MFDLLIKGAQIIDGTGSNRFTGDVGVSGDRILDIGNLNGATATQTIEAKGKVLSPGFVDVHTHLDAQVFWDDTLSPSPLHGVTTVIGGNCGFTIAPLGDDPSVMIILCGCSQELKECLSNAFKRAFHGIGNQPVNALMLSEGIFLSMLDSRSVIARYGE